MLKRFLRLAVVFSILWGLQTIAFATSLGDVSNNMLQPVDDLRRGFVGIGVVLGVFFLGSAVNRYFRYRRNNQEQPISTVLVYAFVGVAFLVLTILYHYVHMADIRFGMGDVAV